MATEKKIFISYSSSDREKVKGIVNVLERRGFRCWHDYNDIKLGDDWLGVIDKAIEESAAFLAFISPGYRQREIALHELSKAVDRKKNEEEYVVVFVFLKPIEYGAFEENIKDFIYRNQHIKYWQEYRHSGYLSEDFVRRLVGANWPECVVDQQLRVKRGLGDWKPETVDEQDLMDDIFLSENMSSISAHRLSRKDVLAYRIKDEFKRNLPYQKRDVAGAEGQVTFYALEPGDIEHTTVYPAIFDNQWVPREFYDQSIMVESAVSGVPAFDQNSEYVQEFREQGLNSLKVVAEIVRRQRLEFVRCLLHNWQVVVNRAYILNSNVFSEWYSKSESGDDKNYKAFCRLLAEDAIVVYLFKESSPMEIPKSFDIKNKNAAAWKQLCLDLSDQSGAEGTLSVESEDRNLSSVRLDWNDSTNAYEINNLITYRFQDFCLTTAEKPERLKALMAALNVPAEDEEGFQRKWREVAVDVIAWTRTNNKPYSRERFYQSFVCPKHMAGAVTAGIVDESKPFSAQMKQIADMVYNINLPRALQIQPAFPPQYPLNAFIISERSDMQRQREVSQTELTVAVKDFCREVLRDSEGFWTKPLAIPKNPKIELWQLEKIRKNSKWNAYMRELSESKIRSRLNEPDFFNIKKVWRNYSELLDDLQKDSEEKERNWEKVPGALTVIYHFEEIRIISIYKNGCLKIYAPEQEALESNKKNNGSLSRKTGLFIDYICGDVTDPVQWDNPFLIEIRLFEGMTHETGGDVYDKVMECLKNWGADRTEVV